LDWTLSIEQRLEYLASNTPIIEQIAQLTNQAPGIYKLYIPSYNWLNDDEHGVRLHHATSFPNGCALGATWDSQLLHRVAQAIAVEARGLHNGFVHEVCSAVIRRCEHYKYTLTPMHMCDVVV
jgi:beta-glucosidase